MAADGSGGSGTIFHSEQDRAFILTCKHVVMRAKTATVYLPNQLTVTAAVTDLDGRDDLAILEMPTKTPIQAIAVATTHPTRGMFLWQVGYPYGRGPTQRTGQVEGYNVPAEMAAEPRIMSSTFTVDSGDSGSGVFLADEGKLCGVVSVKQTVGNGPGKAGIVELKEIRRFTEACLRLRCRPSPPPPLPIRPAPSPTPGPRFDDIDAKLKASEDALRAAIAELQKPAAPGPIGPAGPQGPKGEPGKNADESCLKAEIDLLKQEIARQNRNQSKPDESDRIQRLESQLQQMQKTIANLKGTIHIKVQPK